jgi:hypothetical protein
LSSQLDILALEPFFGGARRQMLETLIRCSRHRWTLLKLPPRRIERRLQAAAHWFSEQLSRHWVGRVDVLFTSEALNLADFYRRMPNLARKPSVVYFHNNQLPDPAKGMSHALDFVNLNSATAASEIWFNSLFHLRTFLSRATALVDRHPELSSRNPMPAITAKTQLLPPPIDLGMIGTMRESGEPVRREKHTIFADTRDADARLLNAACATLTRRGEQFRLITVGPLDDVAPDLPRTTISESDENVHVHALLESGVIISTRRDAPADHHAVRALAAGCWPVFPNSGVYPELLPKFLHSSCLYDGSVDQLASRVQDTWHLSHPDGYEGDLHRILKNFDAIAACKAMDDRLSELAVPA